MHVLFVSHSLPLDQDPLSNVGGMQRVAADLLAALSAVPGVHVTPLVLRTPWHAVTRKTVGFLLGLLHRVPRIARRDAVDVVLFSSLVTASTLLATRHRLARRGVRTAAIVHGRDVTLRRWGYQRIVRRTLQAADRVLAVSPATAQACLTRGAAPDRVVVVPNGVDPARFPEEGAGTGPRSDLTRISPALPSVSEETFVLLSVGRHVPRKGVRWFVEHVVPQLPEAVHYWIVGTGPDTRTIEREARHHGVAHRVTLLGTLDERALHTAYRAADLFVMPNLPTPDDLEGFGVVMLEAGLCGLPVVAADVDGIPAVVREDVNGWLVRSGDAQRFAEVIVQRLTDREALARFGERASGYVRETFAWPQVADRYVQHLRSLVGSEPATLKDG